MIKLERAILITVLLLFATTALAMKGMGHSNHDTSGEEMDHSSMTHDSSGSNPIKVPIPPLVLDDVCQASGNVLPMLCHYSRDCSFADII